MGNDPKTGKVLTVRLGKFGPLVQMGANDDPDKKYAGLQKGQLIESITLEEALELFTLPRKVGGARREGDYSIVRQIRALYKIRRKVRLAR